VSATGLATFNSKDVRDAKLVTVNSTTLVDDANGKGLASNYSLPTSVTASGSITKKALTYTASKASSNTGNTPTGLGGVVSGFVTNETQSTATTGALAWTTPANSVSSAGSYGIYGSGLLADNYSFSQAVGNDSALTLKESASLIPVVNTTISVVVSSPSLVNPAQVTQSIQQLSALDINTLPATSAGPVQTSSAPSGSSPGASAATDSTAAPAGPVSTTSQASLPSQSAVVAVIKPLGGSGLVYVKSDGVNLPATLVQASPADPAQNP